MLLDALKKIGFTQQEAIIYIHLCQNGELTGYEAAKLSGISRSNAYAALSSLVDKGYAFVIEGSSVKYIAIPKDDLLNNVERDFNETLDTIRKELYFNKANQDPYITIVGETHILNKLKNLIEASDKRIYISCDEAMILLLENDLQQAIQKGLKVVILSPKDIQDAGPHTYYPTDIHNSFKVIADTSEVIAGTLQQCLYSKNPTLLSLIRESFINEIAVLENKMKSNP